MSDTGARYPIETPVTAYGNGGFRFAEISHKGSILCLPIGIFAWDAVDARLLTERDFAHVFATLKPHTTLLLGTGAEQIWPSGDLTRAFTEKQIGLEPMSTGAAARTYNVLLAEKRSIAAALIAVE